MGSDPGRIRAARPGEPLDPRGTVNPVPKNTPKAPDKQAPVVEKAKPKEPDWDKISKKLEPYAAYYERWRGKAISNEEYSKLRGCFDNCDLVHPDGRHFPPTDGIPPLLVTYLGEWGVTHRRHDGSREQPSYIFASNAQPVRITDPFDKMSYINKHRTNPEVWAVAFAPR